MRKCLTWLCCFGVVFCGLISQPVLAEIDLSWRPHKQTVEVGDTIEIGLYAASDDDEPQDFWGVRVLFTWDPEYMRVLGVDDTGAPDWSFSGFWDDSYGINEEFPPRDGDGLYWAFAGSNQRFPATPEGTLITTFQFEALKEIPLTKLRIVRKLQKPPKPAVRTVVLDGWVPGKDVLGKIGRKVKIQINPVSRAVPDPCPTTMCMARYAYPPEGRRCAEPRIECEEGNYCYCVEIKGALPLREYTLTCETREDQVVTTDSTGHAIACWDIGRSPYLLIMGVDDCNPPDDRLMCGMCYCIRLWQGQCWTE